VLEKGKHLAQVKKVPQQIYLEYLTQKKQILTVLDGLLSQQYVMAKMDEAKERVSFLIIDEPILAKKPIKPKKLQVLAMAFAFGLFVSFFYIFVAENLQKLKT